MEAWRHGGMAREHAKESCQIVDGRHLPPVFALLPNSHSGEGALQVLLLALPSRSKGRRAAWNAQTGKQTTAFQSYRFTEGRGRGALHCRGTAAALPWHCRCTASTPSWSCGVPSPPPPDNNNNQVLGGSGG